MTGLVARAIGVLCLAVSGLTALALMPPVGLSAAATPDAVEAAAAAWALWAIGVYVAGVLALSALLAIRSDGTLVDRLPHHVGWAVRLVVGGGAMSIAITPAANAAVPAHPPPTGPLDWVATAPFTVGAERAVTVRAGDTLWSIASHALSTRDPTLIAAAWPRWYATNAAVIGPNPDHLVPGQRLTPPAPSPRRP